MGSHVRLGVGPRDGPKSGSSGSPACDTALLVAYAERRLDARRSAEVRAHIDSCAYCFAAHTEALRSVDATAEVLVDTTGGPTEAPRATDGNAREPLRLGSIVGRYRVDRLIGEGGMGSVYEAYDPQLDRRVALKLLLAGQLAGEGAGARLSREARTMAKLSHPNVVTVFDAGEFGDDFFIAMELVPGVTLAMWLAETKRTFDEVMKPFLAAGRGLAAAHAAGIVHRDFKPDNVLIDKEGRVAVTDFGLAVPPPRGAPPEADTVMPSLKLAVTRAGVVLGTPRYMSPEQYAGVKLDARSDQFSFAIALYHALSNQWPFDGETVPEVRLAVASGRIRDLPAEAGVPEHVEGALVRALAPLPEDRFPSLEALLAVVEASRAAEASTEVLRPRARGRAILIALIAAVLAVIAGVGIVAWRRPLQGPTLTPGPTASLPPVSRRPGGRTPVLMLGLDNQSGDARFDDAVDAVIGETLFGSRRMDRYPPYQMRSLAAELGVDPTASSDAVSKALLARDGGIVLALGGTLARMASGFRITVTLRDAASGRMLLETSEDAKTPSEVLAATGRLGRALRTVAGDSPKSDGRERVNLSESVEAVGAWAEGQRLIGTGNSFEAVKKLREAVALDPHFTEAHADLGLALYNILASPESAKESEIALKDADRLGDRRRLKLLADYYGASGKLSASIAAFEQLLASWPGDVGSETAVTATALDAREWPLTVELSRRALTDHPEAVAAHQNLVAAELAKGSLEDAVRDGEAAIARFVHPPRYTFAHVAMAEVLLGQRAQALETLQRLEVVDPEFADETRADLAFYEGRLDDAAALVQGQIDQGLARHAPTSGLRTEYATLAQIHVRRGDPAWAGRAIRALVPELSVDSNARMVYVLAHLLVESGQGTLAETTTRGWEESISVEERMYGAILRGDVLLRRGKARDAISAYRDAGRILDAWLVHARLGEAYLADHAWADADRELTLSIARRGEGTMELTPGLHALPPVYYGLALAKQAEGDPGAAAGWRAFLAIEPSAQRDPLADDARRRLASSGN